MSDERPRRTSDDYVANDMNKPVLETDEAEASLRPMLIRTVKIAAIVVGLLLLGVAVSSMFLGGGEHTLPFDYDGFD